MSYLLVILTAFLVACAPNNPSQSKLGKLSLDRTKTSFEKDDSQFNETAIVSLKNTDFESARRIEREDVPTSFKNEAPEIVIEEFATETVEELFPKTELKLLHVRSGRHFHYATFQQSHKNKEVFGARLIVRLTAEGDWVTVSSTTINPELLNELWFWELSQRFWLLYHARLFHRSFCTPWLI